MSDRFSQEQDDELWMLADGLYAGTLTVAQRDRLETLIETSDDAAAFCATYADVHALLRWRFRPLTPDVPIPTVSTSESSPIRTPPQIEITPNIPSHPLPQGNRFVPSFLHSPLSYLSSGWPAAYLIATVIFAVGALLGTFINVSQPTHVAHQRDASGPQSLTPDPSAIVGQITGLVDCKWAGTDRVAREVVLGSTYKLASGLVEITYDTGAKVILQGPVTYEVDSTDGGYLSLGKLTARVDAAKRQAANPAPRSSSPALLFSVRTPTAVVTDLGTEFGVEVDEKGDTVSHVFRGAVRVQRTAGPDSSQDDGQVLRQDQSVRVERRDRQSQFVKVASATRPPFVREMPKVVEKPDSKMFDLVDVVAGGDGFSHRRNRGIAVHNGQIETNPYDPEAAGQIGDYRYHRVDELAFVDGVFIPDGSRGPVQTDSVGHTFDGFPATSNQTTGFLWACGMIPTAELNPLPAVLNGIDYSGPDHCFLWMHTNKAITFDLDAIRQANRNDRIDRFSAVVGNINVGMADVWVLVDGKTRYRRREISVYNNGFAIAVPIGQHDRFLTLAATDGGDDVFADWILFGDPRLEMAPQTATRAGKEVHSNGNER